MPVSRRRNPKDCEKIPPAKDRKAENWGADWKAREHTKVCDPTKDGGVPVLLLTSRRRNRQRIVRKYPPAKDYGAEKKGYSEGKREHTTVCDRLSKEEGSPFYARKPTPEPAKDYGAETWGAARNEREHTTVCDRTEWAGGQQVYARKPKPNYQWRIGNSSISEMRSRIRWLGCLLILRFFTNATASLLPFT